MGYIRKLVRLDAKLFSEDLTVARRLIEHIDEVRVL
jgi:hypothetical protein